MTFRRPNRSDTIPEIAVTRPKTTAATMWRISTVRRSRPAPVGLVP
jgi:hypothetical protein